MTAPTINNTTDPYETRRGKPRGTVFLTHKSRTNEYYREYRQRRKEEGRPIEKTPEQAERYRQTQRENAERYRQNRLAKKLLNQQANDQQETTEGDN